MNVNDERLLIQLQDCFIAGYTLPQFCIDNGIKKPLFVVPNIEYANFCWELYANFSYDGRITPTFASTAPQKIANFRFSPSFITNDIDIKNSEEAGKLSCYDKIFILTAILITPKSDKIIYLDDLVNMFIIRTYVDIPLLHFLQKNKHIKLLVTNFPLLQVNEYITDFEKKLFDGVSFGDYFKLRDKIKENSEIPIKTPYDFLGYTNEEVYNLLETPEVVKNPDGSTFFRESDNPFLGIKNGKHLTAEQPDIYKNKIWFVGNCVYFGIGVPFQKNIATFVWRLLTNFPLIGMAMSLCVALTMIIL